MNFRRFSARSLVCTAAILFSMTLVPEASGQANVATQSAVFIERSEPGNLRSLEPAERLNRGDRIVTVVTWYRMGGQGDFTITNPLPRAIAYQASASDDQEVSADGGRTWGRLGEIRIGNRLATPEDVTHMRWRISPGRTTRGRGQLVYSGIVR